jgi:Zn-dependent protease with chaperone function
VLLAAVVLAAGLVLLATVVPARLAAARWPARSPALGLVLWQACGLAGGLVAVELALTLALAPVGADHAAALSRIGLSPADHGLPWWSLLAAAAGLAVLLRLLLVLLASTARVLLARRRHRDLVDLVSTRNPLLRDTRVVDHEVPVAYCLPGLRSRLVLSRGVLSVLKEDELRAVLAHEQAHLDQRHDLVVLPFVALGATFPRMPAVRTARRAVALLIEMLADDRAARRHDRSALARALWKVGTAQVPAGGLGAGGDDVLLRARRLLDPACPLSPTGRAAVVAGTAVVLALPLAGVLLPLAMP